MSNCNMLSNPDILEYILRYMRVYEILKLSLLSKSIRQNIMHVQYYTKIIDVDIYNYAYVKDTLKKYKNIQHVTFRNTEILSDDAYITILSYLSSDLLSLNILGTMYTRYSDYSKLFKYIRTYFKKLETLTINLSGDQYTDVNNIYVFLILLKNLKTIDIRNDNFSYCTIDCLEPLHDIPNTNYFMGLNFEYIKSIKLSIIVTTEQYSIIMNLSNRLEYLHIESDYEDIYQNNNNNLDEMISYSSCKFLTHFVTPFEHSKEWIIQFVKHHPHIKSIQLNNIGIDDDIASILPQTVYFNRCTDDYVIEQKMLPNIKEINIILYKLDEIDTINTLFLRMNKPNIKKIQVDNTSLILLNESNWKTINQPIKLFVSCMESITFNSCIFYKNIYKYKYKKDRIRILQYVVPVPMTVTDMNKWFSLYQYNKLEHLTIIEDLYDNESGPFQIEQINELVRNNNNLRSLTIDLKDITMLDTKLIAASNIEDLRAIRHLDIQSLEYLLKHMRKLKCIEIPEEHMQSIANKYPLIHINR